MSSTASLNLGQSQNGVLGNGLRITGFVLDGYLSTIKLLSATHELLKENADQGQNAAYMQSDFGFTLHSIPLDNAYFPNLKKKKKSLK